MKPCAAFTSLMFPVATLNGAGQPALIDNDFFSLALDLLPAGDNMAIRQVCGLIGFNGVQIERPAMWPSSSSLEKPIAPQSLDENSVARMYYDRLIARFQGQPNIFEV